MRLTKATRLRAPGPVLGWLLRWLCATLACSFAVGASATSAANITANSINSTTNITATPSALCEQFARRLPNVSRAVCSRAQLQAGSAASVQGRSLLQRDVSAVSSQLRVLVLGGIHGDELSSTALVLHWIGAAMETPSNIHWRFVPLMNPDGMLRDKPTRTNARGVDLNRNFPTPGWDKDAPAYWAKRTRSDPRRYPGPKPLSEPESRWLHDEMERWKPDLIVSVHAPYGVLDFDGPAVPPQRLGRLYLDQVGIFPGSLGNYGGVHKRVPVVTIELPSALRTPQEAEMRQMWLDLLRWTAEKLGAG
jgi:protein MpaA